MSLRHNSRKPPGQSRYVQAYNCPRPDMENASFAELVFGFVYAVGTDADPVIRVLKNYLKQYGYRAEEFRVSKKLQTLDLGISFTDLSEFEKMNALMDAGNKACERAE